MRKPFHRLIGAALAAALTLAAAGGCAVPLPSGDDFDVSPHLDWRTIRTDHFEIMVPAELEDTGRRISLHLEDAHEFLSPALKWSPRSRVQVLVVDNDDSSNGLASASLRFGMILKLTPPDPWSSINHYDDWLRMLAIHEYTHVLNTDPTTDWMEILRKIYGDSIRPNSAWAPWMLEGLAVYMETRYTRAGRGRSPYYDMVLRAAAERRVLDTDAFVTLDRLDGNFPDFPGGNTRYMFGYYMMNAVAADPALRERGRTADRNSLLKDGEEALGLMSLRSARKVPYFINSNLKGITGKDWYDYWDSFIADANRHAAEQLRQIREKPVTPIRKLTEGGTSTYGAAVSPDDRWIAYTRSNPEIRRGIFLRELSTGRVRRLGDHAGGVGLAFTPDGRRLLFSDMRRSTNYDVFSDLGYYDLESGSKRWLSRDLRAKDPDVSPDGRWVAFSISEPATQGIAVAELISDEDGDLTLGKPRTLYMPPRYDRAAGPKFSPDGKTVAFSIHRNGQASEEIALIPVAGGQPEVVVSDGRFNRFPAYSPDGRLYFVSDANGVDNVYRYRPEGSPEAVTNFTTGAWLPEFDSRGKLFASVFSAEGWDLAEVQLAGASAPGELARISYPIAPEVHPAALKGNLAFEAREETLTSEPYSAWPSLSKPRFWSPLLEFAVNRSLVGGVVGGFDSALRHTYQAAAGYDFKIGKPDLQFAYANRSLGPTLSLLAESRTTSTEPAAAADPAHVRTLRGELALSYSFLWIRSSLTAAAGTGWVGIYLLDPAAGADARDKRKSFDATVSLTFRNTLSPAKALTAEEGRVVRTAARSYFENGGTHAKALLDYTEYLGLFSRSVLIPRVAGAWSTAGSRAGLSPAPVRMGGLFSRLFEGESHDLDRLFLRGYPNRTFRTRGAAVGSLDLRLPIAWIYRGFGTVPAFLNHIHAVAFAESAYLPFETAGAGGAVSLPSAGGGIRVSTTLFHLVPITAGAEFHRGFRTEAGGTSEFVGYLTGGFLEF